MTRSIGSYFIIIQSGYKPSTNEVYEDEVKSENNSFIIEKSNGGYDVHIDNIFKYSIKNLEELDEDLSNLPIYKERVN